MKLQEIHEVEQGIRPPESLKMTLEEFLEHDVVGIWTLFHYVSQRFPLSRKPTRGLRSKNLF